MKGLLFDFSMQASVHDSDTVACKCCGCTDRYELNAHETVIGRLSAQHAMARRDSAPRLVKTNVTRHASLECDLLVTEHREDAAALNDSRALQYVPGHQRG